MSNSTARLRQFITGVFSNEEFDTFCFDHFPKVYQSFTAGQTKDQRVTLLIEHCRQRSKVNDLARALKTAEPELYHAKIGDIDPAEWNALIDQDKRRGCQMQANIAVSLGAVMLFALAAWGLQTGQGPLGFLATSTPTATVTPTLTPTLLRRSTATETPTPTAPAATATAIATSTLRPTRTPTATPKISPSRLAPIPVSTAAQ